MVSDPKSFDPDIEKRIFIKGFPKETTEKDLMSFFETYGVVKKVNIVRDYKSGLAKYGFVTFDSKEVQETLCLEKSVKFQEKTLCIGRAKRSKDSKGSFEKIGGAAHEFGRYFRTRQSSLDYSSSTAPMPYCLYSVYNQNPVYVPAMQASTVAQIPSPNYQSSYIPSSPHQVFTTLVPGNPGTPFVQGMGSDQLLLPMPRTNYVDGYTDYQSIPSIIIPYSPSNDWGNVSSSGEGGMNAFQKELQCLPISPNVTKSKKPFIYSAKEDEESETNDTSHVPVAAVMPTTKEITGQ